MTVPFRLFGTRCMRAESMAKGPGEVVVVMDRPLHLQGPGANRTITLGPGDILFSELDADNVAGAVDCHLQGRFHESDLRFGVALILGLEGLIGEPAMVTLEHERLIDAWLDENTVFAVTVYSEDGRRSPDRNQVGILNGVRASWRDVQTSGGLIH